ncbi:Gfo/Idh/MocA family protein [Pectobacterium versatile]|uniref:Gfo/Idh/MocA family protein n=1 Tax=Enterobacterales TaxID=91347 RepID=UPI000D748AF9|nr:Gfo/Idh/MocA family oxidoreductase [Klebsiella variicola]PXK37529.1 gfo/Idh/MocA family oxidoreductase [Klebsiella variicola]
MTNNKIRVGIVGLQPGRSWASLAHIPALQHLSDDFEIVGVANSSLKSSRAAATACGIPIAFDGVSQMAASPDIDLIVVTVKVPGHYSVLNEVLSAGKHVYCEWPLGKNLEEAQTLAALAREKKVLAVIGTQARVSPAVRELARLVKNGYVGKLRSVSVSGWGRIWGDVIESLATDEYLLKRENGATMLTIPFAHTLAVFQDVLGDIASLSSILETRIPQVYAPETGEYISMDAADQIVVTGLMNSGAPFSIHFQGGEPRGTEGFVWDIHGSEGDLRVTGENGMTQIMPLTLTGARGEEKRLRPMPIPDDRTEPAELVSGNVARIYKRLAADLRNGTRTAPDFDDAVRLHMLLDTIIRASISGERLPAAVSNRELP